MKIFNLKFVLSIDLIQGAATHNKTRYNKKPTYPVLCL